MPTAHGLRRMADYEEKKKAYEQAQHAQICSELLVVVRSRTVRDARLRRCEPVPSKKGPPRESLER